MLKQVTYQNVGFKSQGNHPLIGEQEEIWNFIFVQIGIADGLRLECTENVIKEQRR